MWSHYKVRCRETLHLAPCSNTEIPSLLPTSSPLLPSSVSSTRRPNTVQSPAQVLWRLRWNLPPSILHLSRSQVHRQGQSVEKGELTMSHFYEFILCQTLLHQVCQAWLALALTLQMSCQTKNKGVGNFVFIKETTLLIFHA